MKVAAGDRVILADATDRRPDVLGTVIENDPYVDRDAVLRVLFEDRRTRWLPRGRLRRLNAPRLSAEDLAHDLALLGVESEAA